MKLPNLTFITPSHIANTHAFFQCLESALTGGVGQVLVREKSMDSAHLLAFSSQARELTRAYQAKLIIHSHADIAQAIDADGVHLASHDMREAPAIRNWLQHQSLTISVSCHDLNQLQQAHELGADFAMLSPVFPTQSHPNAPTLGVQTFHAIAQQSPIPVIALGGISPDNRSQLTDMPIAVIRSISEAENPQSAARALLCA